MKLSEKHIGSLRELLARPRLRIVTVSHANPDGDAVGSSLAWAEVLRGLGHEVTCIVPNKYPYFLDWMPGIGEVVVFKGARRRPWPRRMRSSASISTPFRVSRS